MLLKLPPVRALWGTLQCMLLGHPLMSACTFL